MVKKIKKNTQNRTLPYLLNIYLYIFIYIFFAVHGLVYDLDLDKITSRNVMLNIPTLRLRLTDRNEIVDKNCTTSDGETTAHVASDNYLIFVVVYIMCNLCTL